MLERLFKLKEHGTTVKTEMTAGLTTFMTMAYILAVNPNILGAAGMDATAVLLATCIASFLGSACMALMANLPFALSAGMGLNAFFAYTVVLTFGYSWQVALLAVFIEGLLFIALSLSGVREAIFNSIPYELKQAVSVGIGLFIAFIGLQNSGLCVDNPATLVSIVNFTDHFSTRGICTLLTIAGIFITAVLYIKQVRGSILFGILLTWILGIICQLLGVYVPDPSTGFFSLLPRFELTDFSIGVIQPCAQGEGETVAHRHLLVPVHRAEECASGQCGGAVHSGIHGLRRQAAGAGDLQITGCVHTIAIRC